MKNKKKLLVIAEICCPQEIKNRNALAYAIKHLLCVHVKVLKPLDYQVIEKMLVSFPHTLQLLESGSKENEIDQPGCCATLFTREANFRVNTRVNARTCAGLPGSCRSAKGRGVRLEL